MSKMNFDLWCWKYRCENTAFVSDSMTGQEIDVIIDGPSIVPMARQLVKVILNITCLIFWENKYDECCVYRLVARQVSLAYLYKKKTKFAQFYWMDYNFLKFSNFISSYSSMWLRKCCSFYRNFQAFSLVSLISTYQWLQLKWLNLTTLAI